MAGWRVVVTGVGVTPPHPWLKGATAPYASVDDFMSDVRLIEFNARLYHLAENVHRELPQSPEIAQAARVLVGEAERMLEERADQIALHDPGKVVQVEHIRLTLLG